MNHSPLTRLTYAGARRRGGAARCCVDRESLSAGMSTRPWGGDNGRGGQCADRSRLALDLDRHGAGPSGSADGRSVPVVVQCVPRRSMRRAVDERPRRRFANSRAAGKRIPSPDAARASDLPALVAFIQCPPFAVWQERPLPMWVSVVSSRSDTGSPSGLFINVTVWSGLPIRSLTDSTWNGPVPLRKFTQAV